MYWDGLGRQLRLEGPIVKSPSSESDTYFASRPALSQFNAIVSEQSQPIASVADLERRGAQVAAEYQLDVADPALLDRWDRFFRWPVAPYNLLDF